MMSAVDKRILETVGFPFAHYKVDDPQDIFESFLSELLASFANHTHRSKRK